MVAPEPFSWIQEVIKAPVICAFVDTSCKYIYVCMLKIRSYYPGFTIIFGSFGSFELPLSVNHLLMKAAKVAETLDDVNES